MRDERMKDGYDDMSGAKKSVKLNTLLNAVRQSSALIFQLITFPYVSRVLGSSEYGRYSFSFTIVSYFLLLSTFGINTYAVREGARIRDDREGISSLASDLLSINLMTTAAAYIILGVLIFCNAKIRDCSVLIAIQSVSLLLTAIGVDWINIIYEDYLYIALRYIALQVLSLICILFLVKTPGDTAIYCFLLMLASFGGNLVNLAYVRRYVRLKIRIKSDFCHYMKPLAILFVNSLATTVYVNSDITMLGFYCSNETVGVYSFASKLYNMLKQFINSIVTVTVPRLAYLKGQNDEIYRTYIKKIMNYLIFLTFPIAVGFTIFSDSVIYIVGGTEYLSGTFSFRILMLALIFALLASVFTNGMLIINRQEKYCLIATLVSAVLNVVLNIFLIPKLGMAGAAVTTVIAEMVNLMIQSHFAKDTLKAFRIISKKDFITLLGGCCMVAAICKMVNYFMESGGVCMTLGKVLVGCVLSAIGYYLILFLFKNDIAIEIYQKVKLRNRKG